MPRLTWGLCTLLLSRLVASSLIPEVSDARTVGRFTFWQYPAIASVPCDVTNGPDGAVYIEGLLSNSIVRLDPKTDKITDQWFIPFDQPVLNSSVTLPKFPGLDKPFFSCALVTGYDGHLFASNGLRNQLVRVNVTTGKVDVFTAPNIAGNLQPLNDITAAPDGIYFTQTTGNVISKFDYETHAITNFHVPTLASDPLGIYYASDGGIWFLETVAQKYGRLDRSTEKIVEYPLPETLFGPLTMRAETEGKYIWFTGGVGGNLGRIDIEDGTVKSFPIDLTHLTVPVELCPAAWDASTLPKNRAPGQSDIYFTHEVMASLGRLSSGTGKVVEIPYPDNPLPISPLSPNEFFGSGIFCSPGDYVWFTEAPSNRIVRYKRF